MRVILSALLVCSLVGCGKKKEEPKTTTETKPVTVDTSKPGEAPAPAAPAAPAPAAATVDVCSFVSNADIEKVLGAKLLPNQPTKQDARGSFLGGCHYTSEKGTGAMVSARPASEFDATAGGDAKDVPGVGEKAKMTKYGVMVLPAGKSYFMQVMAMDGTNIDEAKSIEVSKLAVAGAK